MRAFASFASLVDGASVVAAAAVGDPTRTRIVQGAIVVLLIVGAMLAATAVWLFRVTRRDHPVLMPLELMGRRSWRRADPVFQRRLVDDARPEGAQPLSRMRPVPDHDEEFDRGPSFGDVADLAEPTPDHGANPAEDGVEMSSVASDDETSEVHSR